MQKPEISVVVPLYNKRGTVLRCIRSVLAQSFPGFELIIVDDGSTDGSVEQLSSLRDPRIQIVRQENQGVSAARNRGIACASADLIAFLDADDLWEPDFLHAILELRTAFPQAGLYATGVGRCWLDGRPDITIAVRPSAGSPGTLVDDYYAAVRHGDFISASNVCVPKAVLDQVGSFQVGESIGEDVDLWARINLQHPFACHPEILAWYFTPPGGTTHLSNPWQPEPPLVVRTLSRWLSEGLAAPAQRRRVVSYMNWQLWRYACSLLWQGDRATLLTFLATAPLSGTGAHLRVGLLALLARALPLRLVSALVFKTAAIMGWLAAAARRVTGRGSVLISTRRPCGHRANALDLDAPTVR